jgi:hypothetical protein
MVGNVRKVEQVSGESFYQRFPRRLVVALSLGIGLSVYLVVLTPAAFMATYAFLMRLILAGTILMLIYNVFAALLVLGQPALRLDASGLTFRGLYIPWQNVRKITPYRTTEGAGLGVDVDAAAFSAAEQRRGGKSIKALTPRLFERLVERHGVLPLPPMRGIDNEDLTALMNNMRLRLQ